MSIVIYVNWLYANSWRINKSISMLKPNRRYMLLNEHAQYSVYSIRVLFLFAQNRNINISTILTQCCSAKRTVWWWHFLPRIRFPTHMELSINCTPIETVAAAASDFKQQLTAGLSSPINPSGYQLFAIYSAENRAKMRLTVCCLCKIDVSHLVQELTHNFLRINFKR